MTTRARAFYPVKKSDKIGKSEVGHPTFIRLFKIQYHSSNKYISAHITTTGNNRAHPRQSCALPGKEWGTIRGNDGPGRAIFFSLSADPIPPPAGQSGWAPGYENSIFMP